MKSGVGGYQGNIPSQEADAGLKSSEEAGEAGTEGLRGQQGKMEAPIRKRGY